ncbi:MULTISPECIES: MerR family transcriptional regulator [Amycolatopsis]|uniref:MerR family transcriptional regulator n=1 Tax=Amycolatopsis thermalba TaxID=944492 RepID=A0ABY4NR51_9PSEU|nr:MULTISPECIES: MerR family transcriptional regulator [Amycolatopsis]OXM73881.1 MerR family transcriptional regulator [Amycolatopsis sp. KNN50.9b]UQS22519.1 MerR family transcriptional regulator [Amycolatopsis thermalba]
MLIGELAKRAGTTERLLRYYERVGLLTAQRRDNGYREYDADAVERVRQIRELLTVGLPTREIRRIIDCAHPDGTLDACPGVLDTLRARLTELDARAAELTAARAALRQAITTTESRLGPA